MSHKSIPVVSTGQTKPHLAIASTNSQPVTSTYVDAVKLVLASRFCVRLQVFLDGSKELRDVSFYPPKPLTPRCFEEDLEHFCEASLSFYESYVPGLKSIREFEPFWNEG